MRNNLRKILVALILSVCILNALANSTRTEKIKWLTFEEAYSKSQESGQLIMIDVYANWCGWCKHMKDKTYQDDRLVSYVNTHFLPVKMNAETRKKIFFQKKKISKKDFVKKLGVKRYPSIILMDANGDTQLLEGYHNGKELVNVLRKIEVAR